MNRHQPSPYVSDLLARISIRQSDDIVALQTLALRTLGANPAVFQAVHDRENELVYLLNQTTLTLLLADSGLDDWFDAHWLAFGANGTLTADRPLHLKGHPSDTEELRALNNRMVQVSNSVWRDLRIAARNPLRLSNGSEHIAVRASHVGELLFRARDVAQTLPVFHELAASRKADALRAELIESNASSTIPYTHAHTHKSPRPPK